MSNRKTFAIAAVLIILWVSVLFGGDIVGAATTWLVPQNAAIGNLSASVDASAVTLVLDSGDGALFPSTFPFRVSVGGVEIVEVTNRVTDTLTVTRAMESTTAVGHATGATVRLTVTAGYVSQIQTSVTALETGLLTPLPVGTNDTTAGAFYAYGGAASVGGSYRWYNGATVDGAAHEFYAISADGSALGLRAKDTDGNVLGSITDLGTTGAWDFSGSATSPYFKIGTTGADRQIEVNTGAATGGIRLDYNDANGSAANYVDILVDSGGDLQLTPSGGNALIPLDTLLNFGDSTEGIYSNDNGYVDLFASTGVRSTVSISVLTAGHGINVAEGANARQGVSAAMVNGTITISTTAVTANSRIFLTPQTLATIARPAAVGVTARTPGTSFVITSSDATDTSTVAWEIFEPTS